MVPRAAQASSQAGTLTRQKDLVTDLVLGDGLARALPHGEAKTSRRESAGHRKKRGYKGLIQKTR